MNSTSYTFAASQSPSSAFIRAPRVSILVIFHLDISSSDATRDTDPSNWTSWSGTPDGNACNNRECVILCANVLNPKFETISHLQILPFNNKSV